MAKRDEGIPKCITEPARDAILSALDRIPTCPEPKQLSRPAIQRTRWGKAIFENREYPSLNILAGHLGISTSGHDSMKDVFEDATLPGGGPAEFIYTVTKGKRRGEHVAYVSGKKKNPKFK